MRTVELVIGHSGSSIDSFNPFMTALYASIENCMRHSSVEDWYQISCDWIARKCITLMCHAPCFRHIHSFSLSIPPPPTGLTITSRLHNPSSYPTSNLKVGARALKAQGSKSRMRERGKVWGGGVPSSDPFPCFEGCAPPRFLTFISK